MKRMSGVIAAAAAFGLAGCHPGPAATAASRPPSPAGVMPALPSVVAQGCSTWQTTAGAVTAVVHIQTLVAVRHARAPQEGATGRVTVHSIDVAFLAGGTPVGWAFQATPAGDTGLVLGNGNALLNASTYRLDLSGRWTPDCRVMRVYWLPGSQS